MAREGEFTLESFAKELRHLRRIAPLTKLLMRIPGLGGMADVVDEPAAKTELRQLLGIVDAMTPAERRQPGKWIDASRRRRIAAGAGVEPHQVGQMVQDFTVLAPTLRELSEVNLRKRTDFRRRMGD